jgi:hypothetical protein
LTSQDKATSVETTSLERSVLRARLWNAVTARVREHRTLLHFSTASVAYELTTMLSKIVILRWIAPADMGLWLSLLLIQTYSAFVQLGMFSGLNRELPFCMGAGDDKSAKELAGTAQSVAIAGAVVLALSALPPLLFVHQNARASYGAAVVFLCAAEAVYQTYLSVTYRADRAFQKLAWLTLFQACMVIVTLPLVYFFGFAGLVGRYAIITTSSVALNHVCRPIRVSSRFVWRAALTLLKVGVPAYACSYILTVADTFPQVALLSGSGVKLVGLFTPVGATITLMQMIPTAIAQYVYPQMSYRLGQTGDPKTLWPIACKTSFGLMVLLSPLLPIGMVAIPWLIGKFFPDYVASAGAVKFGLMSGMFLGASISINALYSLKAWFWVGVYATGRVVSIYALVLLLLRCWESPLEAVAAGFMFAQAFAFALAMFCIYRATHDNKRSYRVPPPEMEIEMEMEMEQDPGKTYSGE